LACGDKAGEVNVSARIREKTGHKREEECANNQFALPDDLVLGFRILGLPTARGWLAYRLNVFL
jgi:hypothetical protein